MKKREAHNKLTWEKVLEQFKEVHGSNFDYSNSVYVNTHTPIEVYCKKHDFIFYPTPKNHKAGAKCKTCGRESQIEKAKSQPKIDYVQKVTKFNKNDDYEIKTTDGENITLICKKHGEFSLKRETYLRGSICRKCNQKKTKSNDKELFIQEARKIYGDKHDYTNTKIISAKDKIEVKCNKHDHIFEVTIHNYLNSQQCPKCSSENYGLIRKKTKEQFIKEAQEVYGVKHDYKNTVYDGGSKEVEIRCKKHNNIFKTLPRNYLKGFDCPICRQETSNYGGIHHHTKEGYIFKSKGRITYLYLIKCFDENEEFYKIGKTFRSLSERFTKNSMPYDYEEVFLFSGDAGMIYELEERLHKKYKKYKYKVAVLFNGYSECYNLDLPIKEIIDLQCQTE